MKQRKHTAPVALVFLVSAVVLGVLTMHFSVSSPDGLHLQALMTTPQSLAGPGPSMSAASTAEQPMCQHDTPHTPARPDAPGMTHDTACDLSVPPASGDLALAPAALVSVVMLTALLWLFWSTTARQLCRSAWTGARRQRLVLCVSRT